MNRLLHKYPLSVAFAAAVAWQTVVVAVLEVTR